MKTLADEIVSVLPSLMARHELGPTLADVAAALAADLPSVRAAAKQIDEEGRAKLARYDSRKLHLLPAVHPLSTCVICHKVFEQPKHRPKKTCSHSCARHLAWQNEDMRERHRASVKRSHNRPAFRKMMSERHRKRCADPEYRAQMSETQRKAWADPETRARRIVGLEAAWKGSARRKARHAAIKRKHWADPSFREKAVAGMRAARAADRQKIITIAADHPDMSHAEIGEIVGKKAETVAVVLRKARKAGLIGPRPGDGPNLAIKARRLHMEEGARA